jgi:hypothetical protein
MELILISYVFVRRKEKSRRLFPFLIIWSLAPQNMFTYEFAREVIFR